MSDVGVLRSPVGVNQSEQFAVADHLGNLLSSPLPRDLCLSLLPDGNFGTVADKPPYLGGVSTVVLEDDERDPLLGCRPLDPALWRVLSSSRMLYHAEPSELLHHAVPWLPDCRESLYDVNLSLVQLPHWSDSVESVIDSSGCFDSSEGFSLLMSPPNDRVAVTKVPANNECPTNDGLPSDSAARLTCTEALGNCDIWDGSRIAEAMLENGAVVTVLNDEAVQQIWQPTSCYDRNDSFLSNNRDKVDLSCSEDTPCHQHLQPLDTRDDSAAEAEDSLSEDNVIQHCICQFSNWSAGCHCVSCIWHCDLLPGDNWTVRVAEQQSDTDEGHKEQIVPALGLSGNETSRFWAELHQVAGMDALSPWDCRLLSTHCLQALTEDHTHSSDELKKIGENVANGKMVLSNTVDNGDGSIGNLFTRKPSSQGKEESTEDRMVLGRVIKSCALSCLLETNDSGLDPDQDGVRDWQQRTDTEDDLPCMTNAFPGKITTKCLAEEAANESRKLSNCSVAEGELRELSVSVNERIVDSTCFAASAALSGCNTCSSCHPVLSVLASLLEENNNCSTGLPKAATCDSSCGNCEEIAQLLPSLESVSDIIFSDTEDSLDSELHSSDTSSVFSSPEPCLEDMVTSESNSGTAGPLRVLGDAFDNLFQLEIDSGLLCSTAQRCLGSFLTPVYTLESRSLWFRDSRFISANVDALSRLRSDWPMSTVGRFPSPTTAHDSFCTAMAQCRRLLPSENTAFCDNIPQRQEPSLVSLQPIASPHALLLTDDILRQSSRSALSPRLWPDDSLSLKPVPSRHQFRPIGTPSTSDSDQSELSTTATDPVSSIADSLTDFTASVMISDVIADSHETYQRFVISNEYDSEDGNDGDGVAHSRRTFQPSFKVQYSLEKAAQTGELSPPPSDILTSGDVDVHLGCLVKEVLSQLSGEFPESSGSVEEDILCNEKNGSEEANVVMSQELSVIWSDATVAHGTSTSILGSCAPIPSDLSAVSSQIWKVACTSNELNDKDFGDNMTISNGDGSSADDVFMRKTGGRCKAEDGRKYEVLDQLTASCASSDPNLEPNDSGIDLARIWSDFDYTVTGSPSVSLSIRPNLSDIWSDTAPQFVDSTYVSDGGDLLPSGTPHIWKEKAQTKAGKLCRMWKSVDCDDLPDVSSDGTPFAPGLSVWTQSQSRPCSVTVDEDRGGGSDQKSCSSLEEFSDECSISASELCALWTADESNKTPLLNPDNAEDDGTTASESVFRGSATINSLLRNNIWNPDETHSNWHPVESGPGEVKELWNVDPLYCPTLLPPVVAGGSSTILADCSADRNPPCWINSGAMLDDVDVAFAFTHLVSGVVSIVYHVGSGAIIDHSVSWPYVVRGN